MLKNKVETLTHDLERDYGGMPNLNLILGSHKCSLNNEGLRRHAHVGITQLDRLLKHDLVRGLKDVKFEKDKLCSMESNWLTLILARVKCLLAGHWNYCIWIFLGLQFIRALVNDIKKVRSDNESEFKNARLDEYCDDKGVKHEFSSKYTLKQNGLVERKNRILIEMARSMLSEYNVSDCFWSKAINTASHASNRLYCHRLLKKTPYELLIGRKPNISYFWDKESRLSKFEKKCDEGFLHGYSSNSKAYRVYNKTHGIVEEVYDVEFDETNGSQEESDNLNDVRGEELSKAMKTMAIGDVKPKEVKDDDDTIMSTRCPYDNTQDHSSPSPSVIPSTSTQDSLTHPRIHHAVAKDHPIDQIVGDISKGFQTRSRIASFCEHYYFVSCIEPNRVDEAL
ncbi:hypothetical protein U9M48_042653 [Paspalum notatum var. saurae]|uniref:Integrase catalytic domain-containing protein n=1 Tax=Paspalum notatum var. saurae TaxID=547442 RepID=A0AAQ3XHU7_PASNO